MASIQTLPALLETLHTSLTTLSTTLPSPDSINPPPNSISLLDTKNELLVTYLQNLVFLILLKLRNAKSQVTTERKRTPHEQSSTTQQQQSLANETVHRLIEARLYLERGVKPLEAKLRYQIDRAVRAAEEYEARSQQKIRKKSNGVKRSAESSDDSDDSDDNSDAESASVSASSSEEDVAPARANLASFARPATATTGTGTSGKGSSVYKPPRIAPTSLADIDNSKPQQKLQRRRKVGLLDEYVSNELSTAPMLEPSIGTNIVERGRRDVLSTRERAVAADRQRYEEENLVRLPGVGKKEKRALQGDRMRRGQYGGEEWSGLGGSAERIVELVGRKKGVLERSRKRERSDGRVEGIGDRFEKKRRLLERRRK